MVPHLSRRVPRVLRYSGKAYVSSRFKYRTLTFFGILSQVFPLRYLNHLSASLTPIKFPYSVWPSPISLAATLGIDVSFFSSTYLDVSVRWVPFLLPMNSAMDT